MTILKHLTKIFDYLTIIDQILTSITQRLAAYKVVRERFVFLVV